MGFWKNLFGKGNKKNDSDKSAVEVRLRKMLGKLEKYKRAAYYPITTPSEFNHDAKSKMGGLPYLRGQDDWPICPNCKNNMQLFLQLNLQEIPEQKENGLVQMFYCTNSEPHCESELEAFIPFSKAVVCRRIDENGPSVEFKPKLEEVFGEIAISGWKKQDDYPHFEEWEHLGIEFDPYDEEVFEMMDIREQGMALPGDKLFGWPFWVQSIEYPHDRKTNKMMTHFFQIDSEVHIPYSFGDVGTGHLTVSPDNKHELGFGWACS